MKKMQFGSGMAAAMLLVLGGNHAAMAGTRIGEIVSCGVSYWELANTIWNVLAGVGALWAMRGIVALMWGGWPVLTAILVVLGTAWLGWRVYLMVRSWLQARGCAA